MNRIAVLAIALVTGAHAALAADLGPHDRYDRSLKDDPVIMVPFSWTGFYIGAHLGHAFDGTADYTHQNLNFFGGPGGVYDNDLSGLLGGGQIGFNWQAGALVFGIEGTWSAADISGNTNFVVFANDTRTKVDQLATVSARLGVASGPWLFYGKVGYAGGDVNAEQNFYVAPPGNRTWSASEWHHGWVAGIGFEYAATRNISVGLEYNHINLGSETHSGPDSAGVPAVIDSDVRLNSLLARVNFRFGDR